MTTAATASTSTAPDVRATHPACFGALRQRRISPEAGHALEILGHAIEYLTDEYIYRGGLISAHSDEIEAIQTLMGINREIYLGCPALPSMVERWRSLLRIKTA